MKKILVILMSFVILMSCVSCTENKHEKTDYAGNASLENTVPINTESVENDTVRAESEKDFADAQIGDIIKFGHYEQDNDLTNGKEEIEWMVLDKADGNLCVISRYDLDYQPYHNTDEVVTWEKCTLRTWLNDTFYNEAFSDSEKTFIRAVTVNAEDNPKYGTEVGESTQDKVFLLNVQEARNYFKDENDRMTSATEYAKKRSGLDSDTFAWFLRSPGCDNRISVVGSDGIVNVVGALPNNTDFIRPTVWIKYENSEEENNAVILPADKIGQAVTGDTVKFGVYEQDNDLSNGKEDIEWIVLDKDDAGVFVISKYALDAQKYHYEKLDITWEDCTLRSWLNDTFYNNAFSYKEKSMIATTDVEAVNNSEYGTDAGDDTQDKVFLLNIDEINKYFASDSERKCVATDYAQSQGVWASWSKHCRFWLRTPGNYVRYVTRVRIDGSVNISGDVSNDITVAVRPAMWISTDESNADEDNFSEFKKMPSDEIYESLIKPAEEIYALVNLGDSLSLDYDDHIMVDGSKWYKVADEKMNTVEACRKCFSEYFSDEYTEELIKNFTEFAKISNGYLYMIGHGSGGNMYFAYEDYSIKSCEKDKVVIQRQTYFINDELFEAVEKYCEDEYNKTGKSIEGRDLPKEYLSEEVDTYLYNYICEDGKWVFDNFGIGWM